MTVVRAQQLSEQLADLGDAQLVGVIDKALANRPGLRLIRDDLLAVLQVGLTADQIRTALAHVGGPVHPSAQEVAAQLRIEGAARAQILGFAMLDAAQVADLLGSAGANRRQAASGLRKAGKLLGLDDAGRVRYPAFQIDAARARVRPIVSELNNRLDARQDPWAVASWWLLPHARLPKGRSPAELAARDRAADDQLLRTLATSLIGD